MQAACCDRRRTPGINRPLRTTTAVLLALAAAIPGCARPHRGTGLPSDTVVIATSVDMSGVNQLTGVHSRFKQDILDLLFLSLFEERADFATGPPPFGPALARSYSWSSDGRTLVIELREDVAWSDGTPLTAADVLWTYRAQTDPDIAWAWASSKRAIDEVEVLDSHTVAFHFSRIYPGRLADVNTGVILPARAWSRLPFSRWRSGEDWFRRNLVVSGPYILESWRPNEEIVLTRNPAFHRRDIPRIDEVVFRVMPDYSSRLERLLQGDVDFVEQIRADDLRRLDDSPLASAVSYWHRQYSFVVWNGCREPFSDPLVRRALSLAIDRSTIVAALFGDQARVGVGPIPQSVWAFDTSLEPLPYDPRAASGILAAAGWRDSDDDGVLDRAGTPLRFDLSTNSDNPVRLDAAAMIQEQLGRVGVDARIVSLEFNTLLERNLSHDFDATIGAWGIDTTLDLGYAFHRDSIGDGYNYGCYSSPEADRLIEELSAAPDLRDSLPRLYALQRLIHRDQPYTFLWEPRRTDGVGRRLRGVRPSPLSAFFNLEEWSIVDPDL